MKLHLGCGTKKQDGWINIAYDELDKIEIYAHANKFSVGTDHVSVGLAREKIKEFQNNSANLVS